MYIILLAGGRGTGKGEAGVKIGSGDTVEG